jgi:hypothetical protein
VIADKKYIDLVMFLFFIGRKYGKLKKDWVLGWSEGGARVLGLDLACRSDLDIYQDEPVGKTRCRCLIS